MEIPLHEVSVDPSVVADLFAVDNTGKLFDQLVRIFTLEIQQWMPRMREAVQAGNWEDLGFGAHRFRSSCYNLGARRAASFAEQIEAECRKPSPSQQELTFAVGQLQAEALTSLELLRETVRLRNNTSES